jgi:predicted membrane protein
MSNKQNSNGRIWLGAILIIVGTLIFLRNFNFEFLHINIFSWPFIMLLVGIVVLINSKDSLFGIILVILGGVGLTARYFDTSYREIFSEYWPVLLILLGLHTIFKNFGGGNSNKTETIENDNEVIDIFSFLGDKSKFIKSSKFIGGKITTILSELTIDFRESNLSEGTHELDCFTLFGSTRLFIPSDWQVIIKTTTIFGGFDDQRGKTLQQSDHNEKILIVKGLVLFGGGSIKG